MLEARPEVAGAYPHSSPAPSPLPPSCSFGGSCKGHRHITRGFKLRRLSPLNSSGFVPQLAAPVPSPPQQLKQQPRQFCSPGEGILQALQCKHTAGSEAQPETGCCWGHEGASACALGTALGEEGTPSHLFWDTNLLGALQAASVALEQMLQQGSGSAEAGVRHCQRKQSRTQEARATPLPRAAICNSTKEKENQGVLIQGYDTGVSG